MKSHEVLKNAIDGTKGVKQVAADMSLSASMVYKWCEPAGGQEAAGAVNPLDRVLAVCQSSGSSLPVVWLCEQLGGCFVENPKPERRTRMELLSGTRNILKEFSDLLDAITRSTSDDGRVDKEEAERIRREWENLKRITEAFVRACEDNAFAK